MSGEAANLVERLRDWHWAAEERPTDLLTEAADEIERLRAMTLDANTISWYPQSPDLMIEILIGLTRWAETLERNGRSSIKPGAKDRSASLDRAATLRSYLERLHLRDDVAPPVPRVSDGRGGWIDAPGLL